MPNCLPSVVVLALYSIVIVIRTIEVSSDCDLHRLCINLHKKMRLEQIICDSQPDCLIPRKIDCTAEIGLATEAYCLATDVRILARFASCSNVSPLFDVVKSRAQSSVLSDRFLLTVYGNYGDDRFRGVLRDVVSSNSENAL